MATSTADGSPPKSSDKGRRQRTSAGMVEYGAYIDQKLNRTGSQVKGSDLFGGLLLLAAGALAYLLMVVLIDHWVIAGGLGFWSRLLALAGFLVGGGAFLAFFVLPPLLRKVNPVYAALTIERSRPGLKNGLVNFLLLKPQRTGMPSPVYEAIEEQAATSLAGVPLESAVDRSHLVRFGLILLGIVIACALYIFISPKDPLASAARVIMPWADIERPTRIDIEDVRVEVMETAKRFDGGDATIFVGQHVKITAKVRNRGLTAEEPAQVRFSSSDTREIVDRHVEMTRGEFQQYVVLPIDEGGSASERQIGLRQSIEYSIEAGDAVKGPYKIEVMAAPVIEVTHLVYDYPAYTRLPARRVDGTGDVRALEGTTVTVHARTNQDIQGAYIDFDCDGHNDQALDVRGRDATVSFVAQLREDRLTPVHGEYLLRFTNHDGHENRQPVRHRIEVTADLPPEIEFTSPEAPAEIEELPVTGSLPLAVRATDRDFDLTDVVLRAARADNDPAKQEKGMEQTLLDEPRIDQFRSEPFDFVPGAHGFQPGETVVYWAEARDNRQPDANVSSTPRYRVRIVAPPRPPENQDKEQAQGRQEPRPDDDPQDDAQQPRQQDPNQQQPADPQGDEAGQGDENQQGAGGAEGDGQRQPGDAGGGQQQQQPDAGEPQQAEDAGVDPDSQDGDAFERILEHLNEQEAGEGGNKPGDPNADDRQQPDTDQSPDGDPQQPGTPGEQGSAGDKPDDQRAPDGSTGGEPSPDGQKSPDGGTAETNDAANPDQDQAPSDGAGGQEDGQNATGDSGKENDQRLTDQARDASGEPGEKTEPRQSPADSPTGAGDQTKGEPGGGMSPGDENQSPDAQGSNAPRDKQPDGDNAAGDGAPEPADSPSNSGHESDTEGGESGDRSGEGQKGGGQRADQQGSGTAGSNQPADQGANAAEESGDGATADRPGDKQPAGDATDNPGEKTAGNGDQTRASDTPGDNSEQQPGDRQGDPTGRDSPPEGTEPRTGEHETQQPGTPTDKSEQPNTGNQPPEQQGTPGDGKPGGGLPGERNDAPGSPTADQPAPQGADPNLDYAKQATDLVLENLKDQLAEDKPDQELLDKLKWSREDLERFVERWEKLKQAAGTPGDEGRQATEELDAALRGLGLRPRSTTIGGDSSSQDRVRGLRQTGRTQPPPEYWELYKQYTTGTAKGLPSEQP